MVIGAVDQDDLEGLLGHLLEVLLHHCIGLVFVNLPNNLYGNALYPNPVNAEKFEFSSG